MSAGFVLLALLLSVTPLSAEQVLDLVVLDRSQTCPADALPEMRLKVAYSNQPIDLEDSGVQDCRVTGRKAGKPKYETLVDCSDTRPAGTVTEAAQILLNFNGELAICPRLFSYDVHWLSREIELVMGEHRVTVPNERADALTDFRATLLETDSELDLIGKPSSHSADSLLRTHCIDVATVLSGASGDYVSIGLTSFADDAVVCVGGRCAIANRMKPSLLRYDSELDRAACAAGQKP